MSERPDRSGAAGALFGAMGLGLVVWVAILWASIHKDPGIGGWLTGIFAGGFMGLLIAGAGAWAVMIFVLRPARRVEDQAAAIPLDDEMAAILAELEVARLRTKQQVNAGAAWRVPLCMVGAVALWIGGDSGSGSGDLFDIVPMLVAAGVLGYVWAGAELGSRYRRLYKERVLPRLAAGFGNLAWRPGQPPLDEFRRHRLFPEWDACDADDEIHGEYRGMPLSIIELKLTKGSGEDKRVIFNGLTCAVTLPRGLTGTTVVIPDRGLLGNMAERLRGGPCQPVRLEDPRFEKAYEVYGSDQVSARALLTPAFMERFMALAASGHFGAPAALVQDNRLLMALDVNGRDLFEPPSYGKPAASREALTQLHDDIAAVLKAADAIIDLDQAARLQPRS
ncbi:MAG: DUF3137 domain-containing protein [Alphaproteobacteria bacterium]|nr:DUF3137 domain-containing protein [Alphaproteobacteria bacterium]MBU1515968.1 DUF3137 domain-containing protein [Alphaproteobacteria bacterium]MBU2092817.1 DUF3137 domain-containing protein [Alphaproteobacteria bacterium]MBU2153658.1 DUF3137 domain-containing protein [Alphaproteobacteria bacterium]MBU2308286.1 DUF3137 domain-containing protein [Alphaproteobacteria bacterium]